MVQEHAATKNLLKGGLTTIAIVKKGEAEHV